MTNQHDPLLLLGRILGSLLFILSGYGKLMAAAGTKAYFAKTGVPVPDVAYLVAVAVELGGGVLFLLGVQTRLVALVLAAFTVATAFLGHGWADMQQQVQFMKNLAIAGGFLAFAAAGGGTFSVDGLLARRRVAA